VHVRAVGFARFSPGGSRLLTASSDEQLSSCAAQVWDFKSHRVIAGPFEHDDGVLDARLSVDGTMVVTASEDQYASVWSIATGELLMQSRRHGNQVHLARFGLGDLAILTVAKDTVRLTEARTGYPLIAPVVFPGEKITAAGFTGTNAIWVRLPERAVRIDLVLARQSMNELKELIGALGASQIMRGRGAWSAMEAAQWRGAIDRLINPTRFQECLADIPRWHEEQALECERRERWAAARFHYGRLVELAPTNAFYAARLTAMIDRLAPPAGSR
jgi:hypothetical protein